MMARVAQTVEQANAFFSGLQSGANPNAAAKQKIIQDTLNGAVAAHKGGGNGWALVNFVLARNQVLSPVEKQQLKTQWAQMAETLKTQKPTGPGTPGAATVSPGIAKFQNWTPQQAANPNYQGEFRVRVEMTLKLNQSW